MVLVSRLCSASLVVASLIACSGPGVDDDEIAQPGPSGSAGGKPDGATPAPVDAGVSEIQFRIEFDYRFDDAGYFAAAERRATLEAAAASWGRIFSDDFPAIPAGTEVRTRHPEAPGESGFGFVIDREIDDLLVFVGCSEMDGVGGTMAISNSAAAINAVTDPVLRDELRERYQGDRFQPWTAWISFDCEDDFYFDQSMSSDDDIPSADADFYSVALHELGHVLGFGTADAFFALREEAPMRFVGANAVAAYGEAVPLSSSGVHLDSAVQSDGRFTLMDPSRPGGVRTEPTPLDIAVLTDLGYTAP